MNQTFQAGFAQVDITPPLGVCMAGYYERREATGIIKPLFAGALALAAGGEKWVFISCDLIGIDAPYAQSVRELIREQIGLEPRQVLIHCSHTHTGPVITWEDGAETLGAPDDAYNDMLRRKLADVTRMALADLQDTAPSIGFGEEHGVSFIRRYLMKSGTVMTNPGIGNPDVVAPAGRIDPTVSVIELQRAFPHRSVLLVHFALHCDTVGGTLYSTDYPGYLREAVQRQMPNHEVIFINGAAGDINHIDAMHPGKTGEGSAYTAKIGRILAGEAIKTAQRLQPFAVDKLQAALTSLEVPLRSISPGELATAQRLIADFSAGRWHYTDMNEVGEIADAYQIDNLSRLGGRMALGIQLLTAGDLAIVGVPGELFVDISRQIQQKSPFRHTLIASLSNGSDGYFPTAEAFQSGGYEAQNNPFTTALEDALVACVLEMLDQAASAVRT